MSEPAVGDHDKDDFEEMLAGFDRIINDKELQQQLLDAGLLVRIPPAVADPAALDPSDPWYLDPNEPRAHPIDVIRDVQVRLSEDQRRLDSAIEVIRQYWQRRARLPANKDRGEIGVEPPSEQASPPGTGPE